MADAKIEVKVGGISFSGQGDEKWLAEQYDKLLAKAADLSAISPPEPQESGDPGAPAPKAKVGATGTLAKFFQDKKVGNNQNKRFLATAEWLTLRGKKNLTTGDVTKALSESHQQRLGNPSDTLSQNVGKGYCQKEGREFYVTPEGRESLG